MGIDLLSASGHKINGPKGVGFLYVSEKVKLPAFVHGGMQEKGRRAGTENVPAIVGMAQAAAEAMEHMEERSAKERELTAYLKKRIEEEIPNARFHGHDAQRLANNVNVSFDKVQGESALIMLDQRGICASSGSACTTGARENSHVLLALGLSDKEADEALRFTVSHNNTMEEMDEVVQNLKEIVEKLTCVIRKQ
jgi:cysteine desulfurase